MFQRAERKKSRLRLALCGPSGSGKTRSALELAQGLGNKIALADTEHGSASLYSDVCEFDAAEIVAPYSPDKYIAAIDAAAAGGYDVLIIDSLSHAWAGEGGILDIKDAAEKASRSKNGYAAWREVTPMHNKLVEKILAAPLHIIVTMRTKTAYEVQKDENGKTKPVKIGLAPVQRDGMEYEFTCVLDIDVESHIATSSKDRTRIFDGRHLLLTKQVGEELYAWLESGIDLEKIIREQREGFMERLDAATTRAELRALFEDCKQFAKARNDKDWWDDMKDRIELRVVELPEDTKPTADAA